jgi:hypothetical protein
MINCLTRIPIIDLALALAWGISVWMPWRGPQSGVNTDDVEERTLGAQVILAQLNGLVTGTTIIIIGVGAFAVLVKDVNGAQAYDAFYAAMWAVIALGIALYTLSTLPTRASSENFVKAKWVAIFSAMSLFFSLASGVRFLLAVHAILFSGASTTGG